MKIKQFILILGVINNTFLYPSNSQTTCEMPGMTGTIPDTICMLRDFLLYASFFEEKEVKNIFLFVGPPGTGKTTSIEALAKETGAQVIHISGPSLITEWQNSGAKTIEKKYQEAVTKAAQTGRPVIIFIDEIDAISNNNRNSMHEAYKNTYLELLQQLSSHRNNKKIITILATNNISAIDSALINRAELVHWQLPDEKQREALFKYYLANCTLEFDEKKITECARQTKDFSPRDIENIVRSTRRKIKRKIIQNSQKNITHLEVQKINITYEDLQHEIHVMQVKYQHEMSAKQKNEDKEYRRMHPYHTDKLQAMILGSQVVVFIGSTVAFTYPIGASIHHKIVHEHKSLVQALAETYRERIMPSGIQNSQTSKNKKRKYPTKLGLH